MFILTETLFVQEQKKGVQEQKKITAEELEKSDYSYHPGGRRDPFQDLLAGREVNDKRGTSGGVQQLFIDDVILIGIAETKGKFTAIISSPQDFPYYIHQGDKFADGFVLSVEKNKVIFRKTEERGMPLLKPKEIVKEISPEER